jgi:ribosomal protein L29
MYQFPYVAPKLKELPDDEFADYQLEYKHAAAADAPDRARGVQNISAYTGLNYGGWNANTAQELLADNRKPEYHNLLSYYVEGLAGNYIANWFDPKFVPNRPEDIGVVGKLQKIYYILKDIYNYKSSSLACIVNGLCYRGVEELYIDRTIEPLGHIRFSPVRPDLVIFDPSCYDDNISAKSKKAWKISYLGLKEITNLFNYKWQEIADAIAKEKRGSISNEILNMYTFRDLPLRFGDKRQVIQHYHIETEKKTVEIDIMTGMVLPDTDDVKQKMSWAQSNNIDLARSMSVGKLATIEVLKPVMYTTTWMPEFQIILDHRKDERQLNGRLPLYSWSYISKHGKSIGLVDILYDAHENFQKLQVAKRKTLTQSHRGKLAIHEDAFMGDSKTKNSIIENLSDETIPIILPSGSPPPGQVFYELRGAEPPQSLYQSETMALNLMQLEARMPPALQGRSEIQGESGIHYGRKVIEGSILQRVPTEKIMQHELDKAEGWVLVAKTLFGGDHNMNRTFVSKDTGLSVILNMDMGVDFGTGNRIVEDDISQIDRVNVTITASKENDYLKQAKREMDAITLQAMPPDPTNIGVRSVYEDDLLLNSDFTDMAQKERAERAVKQRAELVDLQMQTAIAQARTSLQMATAQTMQAGMPGGMQGGGMPPPAEAQGVMPGAMVSGEQVNIAGDGKDIEPQRPDVSPIRPVR